MFVDVGVGAAINKLLLAIGIQPSYVITFNSGGGRRQDWLFNILQLWYRFGKKDTGIRRHFGNQFDVFVNEKNLYFQETTEQRMRACSREATASHT